MTPISNFLYFRAQNKKSPQHWNVLWIICTQPNTNKNWTNGGYVSPITVDFSRQGSFWRKITSLHMCIEKFEFWSLNEFQKGFTKLSVSQTILYWENIDQKGNAEKSNSVGQIWKFLTRAWHFSTLNELSCSELSKIIFYYIWPFPFTSYFGNCRILDSVNSGKTPSVHAGPY